MIEGEKYDILSVTEDNVPDITTILLEPCSSLAILSASSINNIPKPCKKTKLSTIVQKLDTLLFFLLPPSTTYQSPVRKQNFLL